MRFQPLEGGSWMPLPDFLKTKKAIVNPRNFGDECFKWGVTIGLKKLLSKHPERVNADLIEQSEEFNWNVSFPTNVDEIWKFEKANNVSINVYCWDGCIVPLKISEEKYRHVDLFLMKNEETGKSHYCVIKIGLAWDAMLKLTDVKLELLNDVEMLLMIERGVRGGNSNAFCRFSQANNKYMKDFDESQPSKYILYLDANNLYGWAMSKGLPSGGFRWLDWNEAVEWERIVETEGVGCFLEVDLEYPAEMHDEHNDFPLAPESLVLNGFPKRTQNLMEKKRMVLHGENLKQYLSLGIKLKKVWRVLMFQEEAFMKVYIDKNTKLRMEAKNAFEKDFFKLMNNSVFGKPMENIKNRVNIHLIKDAEKAQTLVNRENFDDLKIFDEFLIAVKMKKLN